MACPRFEPIHRCEIIPGSSGRLPLIDEWDGRCHANGESRPVPAELRIRCCNQGYAHDCPYSGPVQHSALRYSISRQSGRPVELICVEERHFAPFAWSVLPLGPAFLTLTRTDLDACRVAQAKAYCVSYFDRTSTNTSIASSRKLKSK